MIVEKQTLRGATLLKLEGVIKLGESALFLSQTLDRVLEEDPGHVLIDFSRINQIDSTGIGELVGYLVKFQERGRKLALVNPTDRIRRLLSVARLDTLFAIYPNVEAAFAEEANEP